MTLRRRSYMGEINEAKAMTYPAARDKILDALEQNGWTVKRNLKIPHATDDDIKVWFKPQAMYFSTSDVPFNGARSLHVDMRKVAEIEPGALSRRLRKTIERMLG